VAREHRQHLLAAVERLGEHTLELDTQRLDVRRQAHTRARLGPQQPLGERRQARRLALHPGDERLAEHTLPVFERTPDVPVRRAHRARRMLDRAMLAQREQQIEQRVLDVGAALAVGLEAVAEMNAACLHPSRG